MGDAQTNLNFAYLAQGKIRLKIGTEPVRTLESVYGNSIREKAVRAQQKHSWKSASGDSSPFGGSVIWGKAAMNDEVPLAITSLCGGREPGSLVYSLESGTLCALLEARPGGDERRLWNDNRTRLRHVSMSPATGDLVFSILHQNGTANIGVKIDGEGGVKELTEGDSFDTAPRWVPAEGRKIVFQSAGIGRNREGHFLALGPFSLQQLDPATGEMTSLLEDAEQDYLAPQFFPDGSLLFIRRPHTDPDRFHPLTTFKNALLFPLRLLYAFFQFLNFFSSIFAGRKLTSAGGAKAREMDMKQMMIWGNLVRSQKPRQTEDESVDLVPKSWQLCRRQTDGTVQKLADGVLAYDVDPSGKVIYTNGNAIYLMHRDGRKEHVINERMVEQVFFVPA